MCLRFLRHTPKQTLSQASLLRVEAYVGVLGLLKSECPKLVQDCLGWVAYLPVNDEADCKLHRTILVRTRSMDCDGIVRLKKLGNSDSHYDLNWKGNVLLVGRVLIQVLSQIV